MLTLSALRTASQQVMLIFSDPNCGPCNSLLPDIGRWQSEHSGKLTIALISRGAPKANRAKSAEHGLTNVLLQKDNEVADAYQVPGTPSAVIVAADGTVSSPLAIGADAIRALMARTAGTQALPAVPAQAAPGQNGSANGSEETAAAPKTLSIGDSAPPIKLPDLKGKTVNLAGFRGVKTAVLFWNPGCGYCKQMLNDLRAWEAKPPKGSPKILVVSTGTFEANRQGGFKVGVGGKWTSCTGHFRCLWRLICQQDSLSKACFGIQSGAVTARIRTLKPPWQIAPWGCIRSLYWIRASAPELRSAQLVRRRPYWSTRTSRSPLR